MQTLFGGGSGSGSSQQSSSSGPVNVTPPAFAALQSPLSNSLLSLFSGGPTYGGISSAGQPLSNGSVTTNPSTFSAPITSNESNILSTLMGVGSQPTQALNTGLNYVNNTLSPNYLSSLTTSPAVTSAISAAVAPLLNTFQNQTMPGLQGSFAANGAVLNGPTQSPTQPGQGGTNPANGQGSSAFDRAASQAQTGLLQSEASAAAPIEQQALTLGVGQQEQAANQAATLSQTEVNDLVTTLQAEALPRLIDQYGLDQGLTEFNNRVNVMLQSLGLAGQKAGPDIATQSSSSGDSSSDYSSTSGILPSLFGGTGLQSTTSNVVPFLSNLFSFSGGAGAAAGAAGAGDAIDSALPFIAAAA